MPRRRTTTAEYQRRVLHAQLLVQARLDQDIDVASLAEAAHFSLHHFHRIFHAQLGETVMQYVRRLRLERAARTLGSADVRLLDIALEAGYASHEAFTRAFADRFGVPPSQFREQRADRFSTWDLQPNTVPTVEVQVETYPALRVAFMRHRGSYATIGETWQTMVAWAGAHGLYDGVLYDLYGVCPDDPDVTEAAFLRFDACIRVDSAWVDVTHEQEVAVAAIPAGTYAVGVHVGPYDRLHETYLDIIGRWFPRSGYELATDAVVEHYLSDPARTSADDLRTEVPRTHRRLAESTLSRPGLRGGHQLGCVALEVRDVTPLGPLRPLCVDVPPGLPDDLRRIALRMETRVAPARNPHAPHARRNLCCGIHRHPEHHRVEPPIVADVVAVDGVD